ncbi:MAG TPA: GNAT family N-acetyltransferase [Bauldia sp.]|nr:GNAT family N-acetyltransferase [Bauldia sp.]
MIDPNDIRLEAVTDVAWLDGFIAEHWGPPGVVTCGRLWRGADLSAIRAMHGDDVVGLISWRPDPGDWEIVTVDSLASGVGLGSRLLDAAVEIARRAGAKRTWLVTTNDNLDALRFYQRRGFCIAAVRPGAVAASRRLKPSIPVTGKYGIPIRDEIELELIL